MSVGKLGPVGVVGNAITVEVIETAVTGCALVPPHKDLRPDSTSISGIMPVVYNIFVKEVP